MMVLGDVASSPWSSWAYAEVPQPLHSAVAITSDVLNFLILDPLIPYAAALHGYAARLNKNLNETGISSPAWAATSLILYIPRRLPISPHAISTMSCTERNLSNDRLVFWPLAETGCGDPRSHLPVAGITRPDDLYRECKRKLLGLVTWREALFGGNEGCVVGDG